MDEGSSLNDWDSEPISNEDLEGNPYLLFYRIHIQFIKDENPERISPSAFIDIGKGMSTNWSKYSDPDKTRIGIGDKPASNYGVVHLIVRDVRDSPTGFTIKHDPLKESNNHAHTNVYGILKYGIKRPNRAQVYLSRIAHWDINDKLRIQ